MEEPYDYSRHKYCVTFQMDYDTIYSAMTAMNDKLEFPDDRGNKVENISLLFDIATETVIARGDSAFEKMEELKGHQEDLIYVPNIFNELNNMYQRSQERLYKHSAKDLIFRREAINVLQQINHHCERQGNGSKIDFYFAFILPTDWDYKTRKELIQPLFIEAGLVHKDDGQGRIIFFTELESTFRIMQEKGYKNPSLGMKPGNQYVICTVDFKNGFSLNLELVSAQYPSLTATNNKCVPQLLKTASFTIPFGEEEVKLSLTACLEKLCDTILSSEFIEMMFKKAIMLIKDSYNLLGHPSKDALSFQPFDDFKDFCDEQYNLKKVEIDAIRSITVEDIFKKISDANQKDFNNTTHQLLQDMSNSKTWSTIIFYTSKIKNISCSVPLLKLIEKWLQIYSEEHKNSYIPIPDNETFSFIFFLYLESRYNDLVTSQMQDFNVHRDPIILSNENPENSSKPIYFFNIDLSFTKIKTAITYIDENGLTQETENFKCSMRPLNNFILQSELYQRPVLRINKRLKQCLEDVFGSYLRMYSYYNRRNMTRKLFIKPASKLLNRILQKGKMKSTIGNYLKIKSSRNRPKEIRNLFVTSKPNLSQQLTKNIEMKEFFTPNSKLENTDNDLVVVCHPGHIYFFIVIYLHTLNKILEEKLDDKYGNNYPGNSIWYGVSVDKNLLDTVFGSKKKLEKLFFASGILKKDNNLRKAKFNIPGEEILPAIQQKFKHFDFKMKSYFVVAQIFSKHVQLTLHQVVKFASSEEDSATIVIQDELITINNVYDSLSKEMWKNMHTNCQIDYCATHKKNHNAHVNLNSLKAYINIYQELRQCIDKLLQTKEAGLDMDSKKKFKINDKCDCGISISLRDIIETGLKPIMRDITTIIVASLTNRRLFGSYEIDYLFVLGDPFSLSHGSLIHVIYTVITQQAIDDGLHIKEKDTKAVALKESFSQLMELVTRSKPYMYERFVTGTLCQVSSETFAIRFSPIFEDGQLPFSQIYFDGKVKNAMKGDGSYLVIIQKRKPITTKGIILKYDLNFLDEAEDVINTSVDILKLSHSNAIATEKYALLDEKSEGSKYNIHAQRKTRLKSRLIVECKPVNHKYSLKISVRTYGHDPVRYNKYIESFKDIVEPLTLAYI